MPIFFVETLEKCYKRAEKRKSKLLLQDNCLIQNCAKARKALKAIWANLFARLARSLDLNPIENVFNIVNPLTPEDFHVFE